MEDSFLLSVSVRWNWLGLLPILGAIATTSALAVFVLSGLPGRSRTTPTRTRVRLFPRWIAIFVVDSSGTPGLGSILPTGLVTFSSSVLLGGTTELPLPWSRTILGGVTENSLQFLITWNITKCIHVQSYLLDTDHPRVPKTFPYSSSSECSAPKYLTWYHIWTKMQLCSESDQISDSRIAMWINLCVELEIIFSRIDVGYEEVEHLNKLFENKLMVANQ